MEVVDIVVATPNGLGVEFEQFIQSMSNCNVLSYLDLQAKLYDLETRQERNNVTVMSVNLASNDKSKESLSNLFQEGACSFELLQPVQCNLFFYYKSKMYQYEQVIIIICQFCFSKYEW